MNWHFPSGHFERRAALRVIVAGLLALRGAIAAGAEEESAAGRPVVGKNADGYLEVFKVEADGQLLHRWQKRASGDWSSWASLGGTVLPGIAVVTKGDSPMEVFGVDQASHTLEYVSQVASNSVEWSGWTNLGGAVRPPLAVGERRPGGVEGVAVVGRGAGGGTKPTREAGGFCRGGGRQRGKTSARNRRSRRLVGMGGLWGPRGIRAGRCEKPGWAAGAVWHRGRLAPVGAPLAKPAWKQHGLVGVGRPGRRDRTQLRGGPECAGSIGGICRCPHQ